MFKYKNYNNRFYDFNKLIYTFFDLLNIKIIALYYVIT